MSRAIQDWPLDGQISAGIIVVSIVCLIASGFANRPNDYIASANKDGLFAMKPLKSAYVTGFGLLCMVLVLTYAVLQSGKCINMTIEQNAENRLIGLALVVIFWSGILFYAWSVLSTRYWFNKNIFISKAFLKKRREHKFCDIVMLLEKQGSLGFKFADGAKYYLPMYHSGTAQLFRAVDTHVLADSNPICALPIEKKEEFLNKSIIVNLLKPNADFTDAPSAFFKEGVITSVDDKGIKINFGHEEKALAANLRGIGAFHGAGTGQTADYTGMWYVT
jgi:hypothetical protein